jgi:CDP-glycerol glycerophosphotransferase (TagB/SpsB family)
VVTTIANILIHLANRIIPKSRVLVISAYPDIEDQVVALLRSFDRSPLDSYRVVLLVTGPPAEARQRLDVLVGKNSARVQIHRKFSIAAIWTFLRARVVLFTHGLYGSMTPPSNQVVINLWHGMPLKRIWTGAALDEPPKSTFLLSTSELFSKILSELADIPIERTPATGLPRNDLLFSTRPAVQSFNDAIHADVQRVAFFLPTYRRSTAGFQSLDGGEEATPLLMNDGEKEMFSRALRDTGTRVLVKPHPLSPHYGTVDTSDDNIWIISDSWLQDQGVMLYEALGATDALISDVSSVVVDHLCTGKPSIIFFPDYELYGKTRRFMLEPLTDYLPGPVCSDVAQLCDALRSIDAPDPSSRRRRADLAALLNPQSAPTACTAVFDLLAVDAPSSRRPSHQPLG